MSNLPMRALSLAIAALLPALAIAQADDQVLDRVTVTGSRIKKADVVGQAPVRVLTAADLEKSGLTSISEVLQQLTASGNALNVKFNSSGNFGYPPSGGGVGAGSAQVDLRHLGSNRVLVLVDGIRWINETSASGISAAVDLNTIPMAMVSSIEVLEDGASSIYGSDAIAGVVNIITRRDLDGAVVNLQYGEYPSKGDGQTMNGDISYGQVEEDYSYFVTASYFDQEAVNSIDREQARFPVPGGGLAFGSSATPQGRYRFTDPRSGQQVNLTLNNGVTGRPRYNPLNPTDPATSDYNVFDNSDRFNFAPFNLVVTPSERKNVFGQIRYNVSETTTAYFKAMYGERESVNQAAPEPIFIGFGAGTGALADTVSVSRTNPFNPFGIDLNATGPNANFRFLGRRPIEGGPRIFTQNVETWYIGTGLEGTFDFTERSLSWDLNLVRASNEAEQQTRGSYNIRNIQQGLGPVANCTAPCVPINFFGGAGTLTPAMLNFIQFNGVDTSEQNLTVASANITGDLFEMTAGPASFATGVEYRRLDGRFDPDPIIVRGDSNGVPAQPGGGRYNVKEVYGEFNLPVLTDVPGAKRLDFSVAGRYSDYSTSGGETTGKFTARWQPFDDLTLRGTYAEGFRAPSIGELFGGPAQFDAVLQDPCNGVGTDGRPRVQPPVCAALGAPASYRQTNPQISVVTGGNPDLTPESADSVTGGIVYSPGWGRDSGISKAIDFELTYYQHEISDAIQSIDAQNQLALCVSQSTAGSLSPFCSGITRVQTGEINGFQNRLQNFGQVDTDGFDFTVNWRLPTSDFGDLGLVWASTYVADYEAKDSLGNVDPRAVGRELNDGSIPRFATNLDVNWEYSIWSASWFIRHTDGVKENCGEDFQGAGLCSDETDPSPFNYLGATTYHDVKATWRTPLLNEGLALSVGVNNLFDKDPPICITCSLNGYDASTYDAPGSRFAYIKASMKF